MGGRTIGRENGRERSGEEERSGEVGIRGGRGWEEIERRERAGREEVEKR